MFSLSTFSSFAAMNSGMEAPFILLRDALELPVAEELYIALNNFDGWNEEDESLFEGKIYDSYSYKRLSMDMADEKAPDAIKLLYAYLNSREVLDTIERISNRKCDFFTGKAVAYREGHYIKSHNDLYAESKGDNIVVTRSVTFNYFLTKNWDPEWGGQFVWERPLATVNPSFNTLVLFLVGPESHHHVTPIKGCGNNVRLVITGWFVTTRGAEKQEKKLNLDFLK